jgi:hypothetical protein
VETIRSRSTAPEWPIGPTLHHDDIQCAHVHWDDIRGRRSRHSALLDDRFVSKGFNTDVGL